MRPSTRLKQQKIIDVASQLFLEQGFDRTSLDQVIEQCGGSKQTLYRYFGDKQGLLKAVISDRIEQVKIAFQFQTDSSDSLQQQLNQFGLAYLNTILSANVLNIYRIILIESQRDNSLALFFLQHGPYKMSHHLAEFLQRQMEQGNLRTHDPALTCNHLLSLLKGEYQQEALLGMPPKSAQALRQGVEQAVHCFLTGYQI